VNIPSLKLHRPTVVTSGDERKEAARLRARLAELEESEEDRALREAERYLTALREERRGQEQRLAHGLQLGDRYETTLGPNGLKDGELTGRDLTLEAEKRLQAIDTEVDRVTKDSGVRDATPGA